MRIYRLLMLWVVCWLPQLALAAPPAPPPLAEAYAVTTIVDGDTILLADGRAVRLYGIQAPKLALGRKNFTDWPLADAARERLAALIGGQSVRLLPSTTPQDRHGRILADVFGANGAWLQGEMVMAGMARAYSFADNRSTAAELLRREGIARAQKRGIWGEPFYAIRTAEDILDRKYLDSFQLVQGRVIEVAEVKKTFYLNFGDDWRRDFTAVIPLSSRRLFTEAKLKPKELAGKTVRVRGWIDSKNGPSVILTHPEQLEIVGP